ncbi:hypothetical protein B0T20DRAFT_394078 [Sordaria brevicollis]|uniref:Uncharacterized protein n=1 Tax=Sordaria brevicollis TaxID=83679 RepID=A0AAE0PBK5_SORBR|nr:hypothetical protein B0T20DRAFT_394078 [Sordaria brevicollis]
MCKYEYWEWICGYAVERFTVKDSQEQKCPRHPKDGELPSKCPEAKCVKRVKVHDMCRHCHSRCAITFRMCDRCGHLSRNLTKTECGREVNIEEDQTSQPHDGMPDKTELQPCRNIVNDRQYFIIGRFIDTSKMKLVGIIAKRCPSLAG